MDHQLIEQIVEEVLAKLHGEKTPERSPMSVERTLETTVDILSEDNRRIPLLRDPMDPEALRRMKTKTTARIGVGRAGPRLNTRTLITLRADHALARDTVFTDVPQDFLQRMGLKTYKTACTDRFEHLTRPDLGRRFEPETLDQIRRDTEKNPDVLVYASDGLSSKAIEANLEDILPILLDGLKSSGLKAAKPFFVQYGRVSAQEPIAEAVGAKVVCTLIGERPGLGSAESMSAYITYNAKVGMPESGRTVVSNIHARGVPAVEAGAYIAEVIQKIIRAKASGVELRR